MLGNTDARSRRLSSSCAVIKITGKWGPNSLRWSTNSKPDIPGRLRSRIRQACDCGTALLTNSSAEAKVCASNPEARSNRSAARRKLASSSTMAMVHLSTDTFLLNYAHRRTSVDHLGIVPWGKLQELAQAGKRPLGAQRS